MELSIKNARFFFDNNHNACREQYRNTKNTFRLWLNSMLRIFKFIKIVPKWCYMLLCFHSKHTIYSPFSAHSGWRATLVQFWAYLATSPVRYWCHRRPECVHVTNYNHTIATPAVSFLQAPVTANLISLFANVKTTHTLERFKWQPSLYFKL